MVDMPAPRKKSVVSTLIGVGFHNQIPHDPFKISVTFTYRQDHPYSVIMDIAAIDDSVPGQPPYVSDSKRWEFARTLLSEALTGRRLPTLIGDVRVSVLDTATAKIRLIDPDACPNHPQHFDMHLDLYLVRRFLERSLLAVPAGDEGLFIDVDAALAALFGDDRHRSSGA